MEQKQQVLDTIAHAFGEETFPRGVELFIPSANHIFDAKQAEANLNYKKWDQIPLEVLIRNRDRMSYLTELGFRFLLPAFLTAAIAQPRQVDVLVDNIILMLTPPDISETHIHETFIRRAKMLSIVQTKAILNFFEAFGDIYPADEWSLDTRYKGQIEKAIQFWRSETDIGIDS